MKTERHALTLRPVKAILCSRKKITLILNQMKEKTFYTALYNKGDNFQDNIYLILMNVFKCFLWMLR